MYELMILSTTLSIPTELLPKLGLLAFELSILSYFHLKWKLDPSELKINTGRTEQIRPVDLAAINK